MNLCILDTKFRYQMQFNNIIYCTNYNTSKYEKKCREYHKKIVTYNTITEKYN